jgi:hypothetical protein
MLSLDYMKIPEKQQINQDLQIILNDKYNIMMRYIKLRKLAVSYWDFFTFSLGYCLIFPIVTKLTYKNNSKKLYVISNVLSTFVLSYVFYKSSLKYIVKKFNRRDYDRYYTFCKKYQMEDSLLI